MRILPRLSATYILLMLCACQGTESIDTAIISHYGDKNIADSLQVKLDDNQAIVQATQQRPQLSVQDIVVQNTQPEQQPLQPRTIELDKNGFKIDGEYTLLRGGSLQWFKIPETEWMDRLQRFKAAGFNTIDLYVAWNLHEPSPGVFDFETYDIRKFLDMAHSLGLYIYLRPGPYFTNEWNGGGVPSWLIPMTTKDSIEADGLYNLRTPDPDYIEISARYLNELNQVVSPYFIENGGPIILYSVENENLE